VIFSHDTERSLAAIVALANMRLPDVTSLQRFVRDHSISDVGPLDEQDVSDVRGLRDQMRSVFASQDDAVAAGLVNRLIGIAPVSPRLTNHDEYDWHIHYYSPGASLAERLSIDGGMALAQVLARGERERLRVCDAPDCRAVLVDLSRNRSRRYCDARTCGNRLHVAAYRARQRAAATA
jgi:CGNR zinc finger/Putative stress-induced transcription regulator